MFIKRSKDTQKILQDSYYHTINVPLDDYWAHLISCGDCYEIENGYCIIHKQTLMQYVQVPFDKTCFENMISTFHITSAHVCSYERDYLNHVESYFSHSKRIAYFYKNHKEVEIRNPLHIQEKLAGLDDLLLTVKNSEGPEEWLLEYLKDLIDRESLYVYFIGETLVGTGEVRTSDSVYANIGMTVVPNYRRQYIGSYILNQVKKRAIERGYQPICGTDVSNIASQKTIENCGFIKKYYAKEFTL